MTMTQWRDADSTIQVDVFDDIPMDGPVNPRARTASGCAADLSEALRLLTAPAPPWPGDLEDDPQTIRFEDCGAHGTPSTHSAHSTQEKIRAALARLNGLRIALVHPIAQRMARVASSVLEGILGGGRRMAISFALAAARFSRRASRRLGEGRGKGDTMRDMRAQA